LPLQLNIILNSSGVIASIFEGASGTTADFIRTLILLLVKHPQCQEKGQKEIDALLGCERAPRLSDFENLPYVQAIVKEVFSMYLCLPFRALTYTA
jgi:cytochrome P450